MAERIIKSLFWLSGFGFLGYGLLRTCTQTPSDINSLKQNIRGVEKSPKEVIKKNQQYFNVLQSATNSSVPLYRLDKEGIDKEIKRS